MYDNAGAIKFKFYSDYLAAVAIKFGRHQIPSLGRGVVDRAVAGGRDNMLRLNHSLPQHLLKRPSQGRELQLTTPV